MDVTKRAATPLYRAALLGIIVFNAGLWFCLWVIL